MGMPDYDAWLEHGNPYNEEPIKVSECADCGADICAGDTYYEINDEDYCEDCVRHSKKEAKVNFEPDWD